MTIYTLNNLPSHGRVAIFATADVVTPESAAWGDADRRGWVSDLSSFSDPEESRNYVAPIWSAYVHEIREGREHYGAFDTAAEVRQEILDILDRLGAYSDNGDGTYYAEDAVTHDYTSADSWMYALHVSVKHLDPMRGWVEDSVSVLPD